MDLNELIKNINIVEYLSQYVDLEKRGDEWWGISPFTYPPERTPSFSVRENPPFFYDYSSGHGGNVYNFVKDYFHVSGREAAEKLAKYAGYDGVSFAQDERPGVIKTCKMFLKKSAPHKKASSSVLQDNIMEKYMKDDSKLQVWENEGISRESLDKFQVYYDGFSDRLVYPIRNLDGKIVNIGGRTLDPNWKDKGQRKYTYFYPWGTINTIYGVPENLNNIKTKREVILFEGCKSVLLADTWGIDNAGAILTSHLSKNQMMILVSLGCDVVFALDKEVNIRDDKNIQKLKRYINVFYIRDWKNLLDEKDAPVDKGEDVFRELYNNCKYKLR